MQRFRRLSLLSLLAFALLANGCSLFGLDAVGTAACPALRGNVDALRASFTAQAQLNAKIRTFVQAAKDMAMISSRIEAEASAACLRMGADLGLQPAHMKARSGVGGGAAGACEAVAGYVRSILQQGITVQATLTPPRCQLNAQAQARCAGACNVGADSDCRASCEAHASVHASCQPAVVNVSASSPAPLAARLLATMRANLPKLVHAQITLGQRLLRNAQVVAHLGGQLRTRLGAAGAQAIACIAAAADAAASASVRIQVSVRASASVSGQVLR